MTGEAPTRGKTLLLGSLLNWFPCFVSGFLVPSFSNDNGILQQKRKQCLGIIAALQVPSEALPLGENRTESYSSNECRYCARHFSTRNALFRHLRTDPMCCSLEPDGNLLLDDVVKELVAVKLAHLGNPEQVGEVLQSVLVESLRNYTNPDDDDDEKKNTVSPRVWSRTQASIAKLRHSSLQQECDCASAGDVVVITWSIPRYLTTTSPQHWKHIFETARSVLEEQHGIVLVAAQFLGSESKLHAERSCTQHVYQYLLPFSWLPNATQLQDWWFSEEADETTERESSTNSSTYNYGSKKLVQPPDSLRQLKAALKSVESRDVRKEERNSSRVATGRFGLLGAREKRPWHCFADPNLKGDASPNIEPVWRVVDRARIVDFAENEHGDVFAVVEFRGDQFLRQQVRRMVGTAVAIANGWLPSDFFLRGSTEQVLMETPLAPAGYLYQADARFHFDEMMAEGLPLFREHRSRDVLSCTSIDGKRWVQEHLLARKPNAQARDANWLLQLQTTVSPRMARQLLQQEVRGDLQSLCKDMPAHYHRTLTELRRIISSNQWPETSAARSTVIRNGANGEDQKSKGSFTVVNPLVTKNWDELPLGNKLFPKLVDAVFGLEMDLANDCMDRITPTGSHQIDSVQRSPASHCAVNCNAQFTPHVDSGRGAGQSLSLIVGLGDYAGGELFVEGTSYDIRYNPIEFDGWKLRHWTSHFAGERFSLVWFSPESKGL